MKREYYPYWQWEEYQFGMWNEIAINKREAMFQSTVEFMKQTNKFGNYMLQVVDQWPISCAQNLSNSGMNRRAWIGQAACCLAFGCPEHLVRQAWNVITEEHQKAANTEADIAIMYWEENYSKRGDNDENIPRENGL